MFVSRDICKFKAVVIAREELVPYKKRNIYRRKSKPGDNCPRPLLVKKVRPECVNPVIAIYTATLLWQLKPFEIKVRPECRDNAKRDLYTRFSIFSLHNTRARGRKKKNLCERFSVFLLSPPDCFFLLFFALLHSPHQANFPISFSTTLVCLPPSHATPPRQMFAEHLARVDGGFDG